jgi:opacity protein-like surface antigen
MKKGQLVAAAAILLIAAAAAHAQVALDVALSGAGVFSRTTSSASGTVSDSPTKSGAVFGTVRYHLKKLHAFELNIGHTQNSQMFTISPDTYRVMTGITEFSGAYVFTPFQSTKWQPFLIAGGGALRFSPGNTYIDQLQNSFGTTRQTSLAFLYGGGTDYMVWKRLGVRLQYRGLIYKNPDFGVSSRFYTGAKGHMAEPAVGLVLKF